MTAPSPPCPRRAAAGAFPRRRRRTAREFQRDRDRIIHSSAFRRLKHKTQVFVEHEGDYYRTRLTHSIEVAQVARTLARVLGLNEELAEAVALAHDLGHPPFGHTGEEALQALMAPYGGFDHNAQALKIVTRLEAHYAEFDGLNLTWETLEGIAKHNGPVTGDGALRARRVRRGCTTSSSTPTPAPRRRWRRSGRRHRLQQPRPRRRAPRRALHPRGPARGCR